MIYIFIIVSIILIPIVCLFLGLQVIALGDFVKAQFNEPFHLVLDLKRYLEYKEFLVLVLVIIVIAILSLLWNCLFSRNARERYRSRILTKNERQRYSKLATRRNAKKGTQRLEFNNKGENLHNDTLRGKLDILFNPLKKNWNKLVGFLKLSDRRKFNVLKDYHIEGNKSGRRGGTPILTSRNKIWVDAGDTHSLVVGTTRSGKTFGIIHILIQSLRMAGESMIVMDVKGELYDTHAQSLKNDGYDVIKVDFINPKKSAKWNPFGIIIKKYRQAYQDYLVSLQEPKNRLLIQEMATKANVLREIQKRIQVTSESENERKQRMLLLDRESKLKNELENLKDKLPKPNYSEAQELISDIAMRLCAEEDAKDPFWSSSATTLLEGYINFLLEERTEDENGKKHFLPDNMINMYSVKMLHDLGKTPLNPKDEKNDGCTTVLQYYMKHYRDVDDMSSMKLKEYIEAPDNTKGSISAVFGDKIKYFLLNEDILRMTAYSEFELKQLGEKRTAIFIGIHDEKGTYHQLPSILISQCYEELIKTARNEKGLRLHNPVYVVWDEFANGAKWDNIVNALTAGLSRGVRFCLVIQDFNQLHTRYGDKAETIKSNCQNLYYLLAGESKTLEDISKLCGTKREWNKNKNNWDDVPVLSTDALHSLSMGEAVVIRQRMYPVKTRMTGFNAYNFYPNLPKTPTPPDRELEDVMKFNLVKALKNRKEADDRLAVEINNYKKSEKKEILNNKATTKAEDLEIKDNKKLNVYKATKKEREKQLNDMVFNRVISQAGIL